MNYSGNRTNKDMLRVNIPLQAGAKKLLKNKKQLALF